MKRLMACLTALFIASPASAALADPRVYAASRFLLELDGRAVGFMKSVEGGGIKADVIEFSANPAYPFDKHIGPPSYPEFEVDLDATQAALLEPWIDSMLSFSFMRKNGRISLPTPSVMNQEFFNAILTEVGIPACDAADKDPAYLTLKFAPEFTRYLKGGVIAPIDSRTKQKVFLPSNFRLEIDGLDCTRVNKVEALTVKQKVVESDVGDARDYLKEPGKLEIPNLKITMAESAVETWFNWFEDFVIKGNNDEGKEKDGRLVFLDANGKDELLEVRLFNLGIFRLAPEKSEANADNVKRVSVELYCELMELNFKGATPQ